MSASFPPLQASTAAERPTTAASVCLVVPTRNEQDNVAALVTRLSAAFNGHPNWSALFVDDSDDATAARICALAASGHPVRVLHREPAERGGGLGTAALRGFAQSNADIVLVLDADLQHPPEVARQLADVAAQTSVDVVLACRYCPGGAATGLAGPFRRFVSASCRLLTRVAIPQARHVRDPLGGFFAVRREVVSGVDLRPDGFKILLEILARGRWRTAVEVPYTFGPRAAGRSKAHLVEGLRFLRHVMTLRMTTHARSVGDVTVTALPSAPSPMAASVAA